MKEELLFKKLGFEAKYADLEGRKELLRISGLKKGEILDIGIGDCGCMALFLARRGFHVMGIDTSSWSINKSRKRLKKIKLRGSFMAQRANAEKIPFADNYFDAVISYHSLHHIKDVRRSVQEMIRVCKEGGMILISDLHAKGRKEYEHEPDKGFLRSIENELKKKTKIVRKGKTRINMMYIGIKDNYSSDSF